jgi:hypothetical protein
MATRKAYGASFHYIVFRTPAADEPEKTTEKLKNYSRKIPKKAIFGKELRKVG